MKRLGVFANLEKRGAAGVLATLEERAAAHGLELLASGDTAEAMPTTAAWPVPDMVAEMDALMVLGGDGTMLRALPLLGGVDKPVVGVNIGSLGFLTSVAQTDLDYSLDCLAKDDFTTSERRVAEGVLLRGGETVNSFRAFNDVVIDRGVAGRVMTLSVSIDRQELTTYVSDGLIVATPTGSTGHSLSAGGPIVHPETPCFLINVICSHSLSMRPLIISDKHVVAVEVVKCYGSMVLYADGQDGYRLKQGDRIEIRRSLPDLRLIHLPEYSYYAVLRSKLGWRGSNIHDER